MNKDRILETLKKEVRSLLIASKLGLSVQELERDYRTMVGSPLPLRALDYRSTMELLLDMPDVVKVCTGVDGSVMLSAVVNEETKDMAELVSRQKISVKRKGICKRRIGRPLSHMDLVRRGRVAPVLPAAVKGELRDLLSISPLLVSQLESAYYKRFGRSFQYTRYGFYSLIEVLRSVSDFVQVQQTRAGSLLILKTPVTYRAMPSSGLQYPASGNVLRVTTSVPVNKKQDAPKKALVPESPPPPDAPQPSGVTALDRLFMAAEAEYYTKNPPARSTAADTGKSEGGNPDSLPSGPSAIVMSTASDSDSDPSPHTAGGPGSHTSPLKTDVAELSTEQSVQWLQEKFQEDFKLCLSQTRAGFVIGNDLRQAIKHVVCEHPDGLPVLHLLAAYKQYTGKDLPFQEMGFMSVLDLVGALGDMLYLENDNDEQEWRLFDIGSKRKKDVDGERTDDKELPDTDGLITTWSVTTQKPERLKPPVIISSSDGQSLWRPPDLPISDQQIPPDAVRNHKLFALSRMKRGFMMGVYVENVTSPSNFYIRCYSKDTSQKLEDMMIEMRCCYSNEHVSRRYIVPEEQVMVGEIYALRVDEDVWWYRVIVHAISSPHEVQVFYPDFGTLATVKRCWLRFLKSCYMTLPAQAVPATLACLNPVGDRWSAEAIKVFQMHCARGPLVGVVLQYISDHLCLFLCDTSSDEDVYLHQVLINAGHGSLAQEPGSYLTRNAFMQYLIHSSDLPQEISQDTPELNDRVLEQSGDVLLQEPVLPIRVSEEADPKLPYLEAFPIGEDVWDEVWSFSGSLASLKVATEPSQNLCTSREEKPIPEEKPAPEVCSYKSGLVEGLQENPVLEVHSRIAGLSGGPEEKPVPEHVTHRSDGEGLHQPLEEFYISLIESTNVLEKSPQSPPRKCEESENAIQPAADLLDPCSHLSPVDEKPWCLADRCLFLESSSVAQTVSCGSLAGFPKFQIPRSSATAALGPAARLLAAPGSLLHWMTEPGKV
ncbi:tudor domain-containing protein 5 isoform X2 [Dendropsophus ebraccatus]